MTYQHDYLNSKYGDGATNNRNATRVNATAGKTTHKAPHYKLRKWGLISAATLAVFFVTFGQFTSDASAVIFSSSSGDIKQAARDAGLSMHGQAIFLKNEPEFVGPNTLASVCPHDDEVVEFGCYLPSQHKIYILQIGDSELKPTELTSVAHETLHAAYRTMSSDEQQEVASDLMAFYKSNSSTTLSKDAEPYQKEDAAAFTNELHSLAGSEVDLTSMPSALESHFKKYFSSQDKAVQANITFNQNIENRIATIKTQSEQLDTQQKQLDDFQSAHLDNIKAALRQNSYYGDVYTYNKNVAAYNNNRDIYNKMVDKYNANVESYNALRLSFINSYNALFPDAANPVPDAK